MLPRTVVPDWEDRTDQSDGSRREAHMTSAVPDVESRAEAVLAALDEE